MSKQYESFSTVYLMKNGKRGGMTYQIKYIPKDKFDKVVKVFELEDKKVRFLKTMDILVIDAFNSGQDLTMFFEIFGQDFRNTFSEEQNVLRGVLKNKGKILKYADLLSKINESEIFKGGDNYEV